jgi:hypothetical protein
MLCKRRYADTFPYRRSGPVLSFLRAYLCCKRRLQPLPSESGTISDRTQQLWPQVAPWSHKERFFRTIVPPTVCCRIALLKQTEQNNLKVKRKNLTDTMNTVYENTLVEQPMSNRIECEDQDYAVYPLGTFAGTIYKVRYQSNGRFVPSDTGDQLIADGLR